jgi:hypothetical protein
MNTLKNFLLGLLCTALLISCSKKTDTPVERQTATRDAVYQFIKNLGYQDHEIKDIGEEYLVDEDILFSKSVQPGLPVAEGPKTEQYSLANCVGYNVQPNITVRIDPSLSNLTNEITGAINMWNSVINCRINLTLTTATNQNILITNTNLGPNICGAAYFPMNGLPGAIIRINRDYIAGNSFVQRQRTIAHELGHAIGFRHTNWELNGEDRSGVHPDNGAVFNAMHILGTPTGGDVNSLMNGGQCGIGASTLSNFDILAVQFMYPENPPVAGTVPVFRYWSHYTTQDHFYTTSIAELGNGSNNNTIFEGIGFFAFPTQVSGTVPIHRYLHATAGDHFYTRDLLTPGDYVYEGIAFYAYPSAINNASPVYRYYNTNNVDHFYTKNQAEIVPSAGWTFERIEFYAY